MARKHVPSDKRKKGKYYEYKREHERIDAKFEWAKQTFTNRFKGLTYKLGKDLKKSFNTICEDVIDRWYASYSPHLYERRGSLERMPYIRVNFNIEKGRDDYEYGFKSKTYGHRVDKKNNQYIYVNSFIHGWHGGADLLGANPAPGYDTPPHPHPRIGEFRPGNDSGWSYWRWPPEKPDEGSSIKRWEYWFDMPAARSFSPRNMIMELWVSEEQRLMDEYKENVQKLIDKIINELQHCIKMNKRW